MSSIASPAIFDRRLVRARGRRAAGLGPPTFLLDRVARELSERVACVQRRFEWVVDLGTPTDAVRHELARAGNIGTIVAANAFAGCSHLQSASDQLAADGLAVAADEETLPFRAGSLDLVVSALSLQFVGDLPGTLMQIRRALKPDGLLLAAFVGGDSLCELRQSFAAAEAEMENGVSPRIIPFVDVRSAGSLLQRAGFALPVTDLDRVTVRYESPMALMHDLRAMGATNPMIERSRRTLRHATLVRMMEIYGERFADPDRRIRATFEIIWLSGWAPDSSQQQPLAPGSAQASLADALGVTEHSTGERAER